MTTSSRWGVDNSFKPWPGRWEHRNAGAPRGSPARDQPFQLERRKAGASRFVALTSSVDGRDLGEATASR